MSRDLAILLLRLSGLGLARLGLAPVPEEALKAWGNPELALVYLLLFAAVALLGAGRFSIDARLGRR